MTDHARDQNLPIRQFDVSPHLPLMVVARIRGLHRVSARFYLQHQIHQVLQGQVVSVRTMPAPPADVIAHAVLWEASKSMVHRLYSHLSESPVLLNGRPRHEHVVGVRQRRIVDLKNETGVHNGFVFVLHGVRESKKVLFVGWVILIVEEMLQPAWSQHAHEGLLRLRFRRRQRRLKKLNVVRHFLLADVCDRAGADGTLLWLRQEIEFLVELRKLGALAASVTHPSRFARLDRPRLQAAEAAPIIGSAEAQLAQFAIADNVDTGFHLLADNVDHPASHEWPDGFDIRGTPGHNRPGLFPQFGWPIEPASVGSENTLRAAFHLAPILSRTILLREFPLKAVTR